MNISHEKKYLKKHKCLIAMDEAGRGPIAGPIAVGAVSIDQRTLEKIKKSGHWWKEVNDSKKLSPKKREKLYKMITQNISWGIGMASSKHIDQKGITKSLEKASLGAIKNLSKPNLFLVDGNRNFIQSKNLKQEKIKKGDEKVFSIACASIIAKVSRDRFMLRTDKKWPKYQFSKHKGYGTALHLEMLKLEGPCPLHRVSFAPLRNWEWRKPSS